jgi:hypothetical protein
MKRGQRQNMDTALIQAATATLAPFGLRWTAPTTPTEKGEADAVVRLRFGENEVAYMVETKRHVRPGNLGLVLHTMAGMKRPNLLIADHITPQIAEELRRNGVEFIDAAGNAFINQPPVLIWIRGQRPPELQEEKAINRAFQNTGLKILFVLLCKPDAARLPYREIGRMAGVAHGTVGWVMPELIKLGFLVETRGERQLVERKRLLERWADLFLRRLRPKLVLGKYRTTDLQKIILAGADQPDLQIGGEVAAHRFARNLRPGTLTYYGKRPPPTLLAKYGLKADTEGTIEFLYRFWQFEEDAETVPPIMVYADLLAIGDPRCIEAAEEIRVKLFD